MKKIAIVTMNHGYNYGNKLQNYAMEHIYREYGLDVTTIAFEPTGCIKPKSGSSNSISSKILKKIRRKFYFSREKKRLERFKIFNKNYLHLTEKVYNNTNYNTIPEDEYDFFSVGSDQVWNSYFWDFSKIYLLDFVKDNEKKIAYAASFGMDSIKEEYKEDFRKNLSEFKSILLREEKGQKIIKELINKDVPVVLDPTLLLERNEWHKFGKKPENLKDGKYIFTYFLGEMTKERKKKIRKFAKRRNAKIIALNDITKKYYCCNPNEMVYLIENAEAILTDSFHACVLSIIFNKDFYIFERISKGRNMNSRIETLLKMLQINKKTDDDLELDRNYNYKKINMLLDEKKKRCMEYIEKSLL